MGQDTLNPFFCEKEDGIATDCRHGRRSWASARFTCDLQWGGGVGSSLRHDFLGAILSVPVMTVSRWPYLFLIAIAVALVGISATVQPVPHHISRGDFVAIHPSLQKVDRSKLFEVFIQAYGVVLYG